MDDLLGTFPRIQLALSHLRSRVMRPKIRTFRDGSSPTSPNQGIYRGDPSGFRAEDRCPKSYCPLELTRIPPEKICSTCIYIPSTERSIKTGSLTAYEHLRPLF